VIENGHLFMPFLVNCLSGNPVRITLSLTADSGKDHIFMAKWQSTHKQGRLLSQALPGAPPANAF
jgi:hypothetical protein